MTTSPARNILFVETGIVGGGSFESLYQTLRTLDRERFTPTVAYLNRTHYLDKVRDLGVETHLLTDLAYTKSLPKIIHSNVEKRADRALIDHPRRGMALFRLYHGPLMRRLRKIIRRDGIDLLYLNDQINRDLFGCLVARDCSIPVVSHLRSLDGNTFGPEKCALANETVGAFISNSTATQQYWEGKGIDKARSHLLFNAVPVSEEEPVDARHIFSLPEGAHLIGCVARLIPLKNHAMLLEAFRLLLEQTPQAVLLLIGDGPERRALEELSGRLGLGDRVVFAGHRLDARAMMGALDLLVLPSYNDSFGRVLIEGMQAGTPVIGADAGGIPDIIRHGHDGLLVPHDSPRDWARAMGQLLSDGEMRARFVENGRESVETRFNLQVVTRGIEDILDAVLAEHGPRSVVS